MCGRMFGFGLWLLMDMVLRVLDALILWCYDRRENNDIEGGCV